MILKSIKLKNFLSFENIELNIREDFNDQPHIYNVTGINNDIPGNDRSIGSGKSSLFSENIIYSLFGKPLRGQKKNLKLNNLIRFGANEMVNETEFFLDDGRIMTIYRSKTNKNTAGIVKIYIDGKDISSRLKKVSDNDIEDYLSLPFEIFTQSLISYSNNQKLVYANYTERLNFFKQLIDVEFLDALYNNSRLLKDENNKKSIDYERKKESIEEMIKILERNENNQLAYIKDELNNFIKTLKEAEEKEKIIPSIDKFEVKKKNLENEEQELNNQIKKIEQQKYHIEKKLREYKTEIENIKSLKGANCSLCGQLVSEEYANNILNDRKQIINDYNNDIEIFNESIDNINKSKKDLKKSILTIQEKINIILEKKIEIETTIKNCKNNVKKWSLEYKKKEKELESNNNEEIIKYTNNLEDINKNIDICKKNDKYINFFYNILSTKSELRSTIYSKYIVILSDILSDMVNKVFNGKLLSNIEINKNSDIDFNIINDKGYEISYHNLSSGERTLYDFCLNLSLYKFVNLFSNSVPKLLVLDEPWTNLEGNQTNGLDNLIEIISEIFKEYKCDIFIISHTPYSTSQLEEKGLPIKNILVTKESGISTYQIID
jgi:DNA repair exonuclease SbcCD ATPase subunit